jgi:hypothetical protein
MSTFFYYSVLNSLEYNDESPEFFLPADSEQKINERAESVVRPGAQTAKWLRPFFTTKSLPLGVNFVP